MKFKVTVVATEVRAGTQHDITGTVTADSAKEARTQTICSAAVHGYYVHGVPEVEEQH